MNLKLLYFNFDLPNSIMTINFFFNNIEGMATFFVRTKKTFNKVLYFSCPVKIQQFLHLQIVGWSRFTTINFAFQITNSDSFAC